VRAKCERGPPATVSLTQPCVREAACSPIDRGPLCMALGVEREPFQAEALGGQALLPSIPAQLRATLP
jgi:hypothetical protein